MKEILAVDYGRYKMVMLYYNWVMTNIGHNAIMKRDDYNINLVISDRLVSLSAKSFAFPLYIEQVFFEDDSNIMDGSWFYEKSQNE